jgi:hypothetical protein
MQMRRLFWIMFGLLPLWGSTQTLPGLLEYYSTSRGGGVYRILAKGDFLFAAEGSSLVVYDTRTTQYHRVFEKRFRGPIADLRLHGGFLYVAACHDGLSKWDLYNPMRPAIVGEYACEDFVTTLQSIDFSGDTLFLAAGSHVLMLRPLTGIGAAFEKIGQFATQPEGYGRVVGGSLWGRHYVAAVAGREKGIGQGIHIYATGKDERLNFVHYDLADPDGFALNAAQKRVYVFGGEGQKASALLGINLADPQHPALFFSDTVGLGGTGGCVAAGCLRGDTLWVPVCGKRQNGDSTTAIRVYDVSNPVSIKLLGEIPIQGFPNQICLAGGRLHVAMGTLGIRSYDAKAFKQGKNVALPEIGRSVPTGGFCLGSDAMGDKLLTADGSAGFTLHLIQDRKTIATRAFDHLGTVQQVRILGDGSFVACWIDAPQGDSLIVVGLEDGKKVGSLPGPLGHSMVGGWQGRFVCAREDKSGFDVLDLRNPTRPKKEKTVLINLSHLACDEVGHLLVSTEHSLRLFDLATGCTDLASVPKFGERFGAVASEGEFCYAVSSKRGLIRYRLVKEGRSQVLKEELVWKLPHRDPQKITLDPKGLYLGYTDFGIYALDKTTFETKGYYRTGLGYRGRSQAGLRDLYCKEGKIYIVEFFGQVTVLRRTDIEP